jgi:hypothetical protein
MAASATGTATAAMMATRATGLAGKTGLRRAGGEGGRSATTASRSA